MRAFLGLAYFDPTISNVFATVVQRVVVGSRYDKRKPWGFLPMVFTQNNPGFSQFLDEFLCLVTLTFCGHLLPKRSNKLPALVLSWYVHRKKNVFSSQNTEKTHEIHHGPASGGSFCLRPEGWVPRFVGMSLVKGYPFHRVNA